MTRTIEQILAEEKIEISPPVIRTGDATILVGDAWVISQYDWPTWPTYVDGPNPFAIMMLAASVWLLAVGVPEGALWLAPICFGGALGALWSIMMWFINRMRRLRPPPPANRGVTFALPGQESAVTLLQSEDEQELKLLRQKLEETLLPNRMNGD